MGVSVDDLTPMVSGAGAGVVCSVVCSPLDVAKVRVQMQDAIFFRAKGSADKKYRGIIPTLRTIRLEEGYRGWYKGLTPALICIPVFWGVYFQVYEKAKAGFSARTGRDEFVLSAITAGLITDCVTNPFWVVRTRMQTAAMHASVDGTQKMPVKGMFRTFSTILKTEGVYGFYRGLTASFLGLAHVAIQFPLYEMMKKKARERNEDGVERPHQLVLASALSKLAGSCVTYPHEVLRSRMQDDRHHKPLGLVGMVKRIVHREGVGAFYTGFRLNMVRVVPSCMATFLSYEFIKRKMTSLAEARRQQATANTGGRAANHSAPVLVARQQTRS